MVAGFPQKCTRRCRLASVTVVTVNPMERSFWLMAVASLTGLSNRPEPGYAAFPITSAWALRMLTAPVEGSACGGDCAAAS
jgi:hypothetical protein